MIRVTTLDSRGTKSRPSWAECEFTMRDMRGLATGKVFSVIQNAWSTSGRTWQILKDLNLHKKKSLYIVMQYSINKTNDNLKHTKSSKLCCSSLLTALN